MDYKKTYPFIIALAIMVPFFTSCSESEKINTGNTYYVELVNFNHDSLKQSVSEKIFGKVSYYTNNKLQVISVNYITEDYPDMHFFKNAGELDKDIGPDTKKIRVEFGGKYTNDSITFSLQKHIYKDKQWKKTSDMGFIKGVNTYFKAKQYAVEEYGKQITNSIVTYTYN